MANGFVSARPQTLGSYVPIVIESQGYSIDRTPFKRDMNKNVYLQKCFKNILVAFHKLEVEVNKFQSIDIHENIYKTQIAELATWGHRAYYQFFESQKAQEILSDRFRSVKEINSETPAPTFISDLVNFPWEVLYEGDLNDFNDNQFWGMRYSPARILDDKDISGYIHQQAVQSDMLFCLHQKLRLAHQNEWPEIEKLVRTTTEDRFCLLGSHTLSECIQTGKDLLTYFGKAEHNMLHFACHCKQQSIDTHILQISLLSEDDIDTLEIGIEPDTFLDVREHFYTFKRKPLIFLNACQTAGGPDVRGIFNLPEQFIKCDAGAVIATACVVPDVFAAAFARQFYAYFLRGHMTIGEALRATRWYFLEHHNNPLGLAYGLYSPAHYRLAQPLIEGS